MQRRHGLGFAAFCLLAGSQWLVEALWPERLPLLLAQSVQYAVVGVAALGVVLLHGPRAPWSASGLSRIGAVSVLLLGAPVMLGHLALGVTPQTSVALFALVPLCLVVGATVRDVDANRAAMMPALAGLAGALLLLPWQLPSTGAGAFAFGLVLSGVLLTAAASLWMQVLLPGSNLMQILAVGALANAAVLGTAGFLRGDRLHGLGLMMVGPEVLRALLIDLPLLLLLIWLIREVPPERLAARFFAVPLITIFEGLALVRGPVDVRMGAGILLLVLGTGVLLLGRLEEPTRLDLRQR